MRSFGFGTNILVNLLTLTALLRFGVGFPDELVFGRVPARRRADAVSLEQLLRLAGVQTCRDAPGVSTSVLCRLAPASDTCSSSCSR
jgi:hypothetical protein